MDVKGLYKNAETYQISQYRLHADYGHCRIDLTHGELC